MYKQKDVDFIKDYLWIKKGSFMYNLHEEFFFDVSEYEKIINTIKSLKKSKDEDTSIPEETIFIFIEKLTYMYDLLRDFYEVDNKLNISIDKYYHCILELKYEILSLFDKNIIEDYNWDLY